MSVTFQRYSKFNYPLIANNKKNGNVETSPTESAYIFSAKKLLNKIFIPLSSAAMGIAFCVSR